MSAFALTLVLIAAACGSTTPSLPGDSLAETDQKTAAAGEAGQGSVASDAEDGAGTGGESDTAEGSPGADVGEAGNSGGQQPTEGAEIGEAEPPQTGDGPGDRPDLDERNRILDQVNQGPAIGSDPDVGADEEEAPASGTESEQGGGEG